MHRTPTLALLLLLGVPVVGGCKGRKGEVVIPTCAEAAVNEAAMVAPPGESTLQKMADFIEQRCIETAWSPEARTCLADADDLDELESCNRRHLRPEQLAPIVSMPPPR